MNEDFDEDNIFDENSSDKNKNKMDKISDLLSRLFGSQGTDFSRFDIRDISGMNMFGESKGDDDDYESTEPMNIEVINKGEWTITIKTWDRGFGLMTDKVEIDGPKGDIPQEIKDFIKNECMRTKDGFFKTIVDASDNVKDILKPNKKTPFDTKDLDPDIDAVARFWYENKEPKFDEMINDALECEDYETAAKLRDRKANREVIKNVTLKKLTEAIEKEDFVAIDAIMLGFKTKLPKYR